MTTTQFAKKTGWPIEELESMPFFTVYLPLLGLYDLEVIWRDNKTKEVLMRWSDYSWADAWETT